MTRFLPSLVSFALLVGCGDDSAPTEPAPDTDAASDAADVSTDLGDDVGEADADSDAALDSDVADDVDQDPPDDVVEDSTADVEADPTDGTDADASEDTADVAPEPQTAGNVLIIIADDLGVDDAICYAEDAPPSPHLDALCDRGVVFENAWSQPICSPTRATTLTGRFGFRTGVGDVAGHGSPGIQPTEWTLPRALDQVFPGVIAQANIGKWHLAESGRVLDGDGPLDMGWDYFTGLIVGAVADYFSWTKWTGQDESRLVETYITTDLVDDAIDWIDDQEDPWLLWLALTSPHDPVHLPPDHLHSTELDGTDIEGREREYFHAMIEAMDTEIGRLLAAIPDDELEATTVIYFGDNGPSPTVSTTGRGRSKSSLYEGGIHVPMIIAGPMVERPGRATQLVSVTDVFATVLDLFEVPRSEWPTDRTIDSVSMLPILLGDEEFVGRDWVYADFFGPNVPAQQAGRTVRNDRFKLMRLEATGDRFFDLLDDPNERRNLLDGELSDEARAAYDELDAVLGSLTE